MKAEGDKKKAHCPPVERVRIPADFRALNRRDGSGYQLRSDPRAGCNVEKIGSGRRDK